MQPHQAEIPQTIAELPFLAAERFGDRPAQRLKRHGAWRDLTYAQLLEIVREVGLGLVDLGVQAGDRVCVVSATRPEWVQAEFGIAATGAVVVPIYASSSPEECEWVIGDSGAAVVMCEDAEQLAKVEGIRERLPELRHTLVIDPAGDALGLERLRARGRARDPSELDRLTADVRPDDPALIIYTSGTTGPPKGCVLTHRNMTACCRITQELQIVGAEDVTYLFLPMAHVFAQVVQLGVASVGGAVAFCSGGTATIVPDCAEVRPTYIPSVPRIFEKVHALFASQVPADALAKMVEVGLAARRLERAGQPLPDELRRGFEQADAALFAKVRGVFGGRLRIAISGAAPIAPEIVEFFHAAGVPVYEGWGLSESAAVGTLNTADALRIGSVGRAVPGCEVGCAEDGELLLRGPHIFAGYWRNPRATAAAVRDGWLLTGDLGSIDEDGFVTITGRKKDIIITSGGKNITPANLENDLRQSPWISHAVLYGDRRPYLVALITLDAEQLLPWAAAQGLQGDLATVAAHPAVRALIQSVVDRANARYGQVGQVKDFAILGQDFTQESGELTPTLKLKRQVVSEKYADVFDSLYDTPG